LCTFDLTLGNIQFDILEPYRLCVQIFVTKRFAFAGGSFKILICVFEIFVVVAALSPHKLWILGRSNGSQL